MSEQRLERIDYLISICKDVILTKYSTERSNDQVDGRLFNKFRAAGLSYFAQQFGTMHPYYESFAARESPYCPSVESTLGILEAAKDELSNGWHKSMRGIVSAEVFSDFVEMAQHLLNEGYKDAAAVMLGSTLEEHLRQLCRDNAIAVTLERDGKQRSVKADTLNVELAKVDVYSLLDQKNVTAWLAIRNSAAHGKYDDYSLEQVRLLAQSVADFMARTVQH